MKYVKLRIGLLIEDINHPAGAVVEVTERRAEAIEKAGAGDHVEGPDPEPPAEVVTVPPEMDAGPDPDALKPRRARAPKGD